MIVCYSSDNSQSLERIKMKGLEYEDRGRVLKKGGLINGGLLCCLEYFECADLDVLER